MAPAGPVKTILFDFGGTLDADGVAWKERFHACYRAEGLGLPDDVFDRHFYDADDPLVGGVPDTLGFDETVARLAANFEAGLDHADPARGARVAARFTEDARAILERNAKTMAVLGKRYALGIVSNFYGNLGAVCRDTGIDRHLTVMVDSHQVGVEKPDRKIFDAALDRLDCAASECIFVGDSLRRDRAGARNAGMRFIWLAAPDASAGDDPIDHPVVASLPDLTEVLQ
jgi:HAD superfamily hydrolase (TIGR01549 family)